MDAKQILRERHQLNRYDIEIEDEKRLMAIRELKRLRAENSSIKELFELQGWTWNEKVEDNVTRVYNHQFDCRTEQREAA